MCVRRFCAYAYGPFDDLYLIGSKNTVAAAWLEIEPQSCVLIEYGSFSVNH